MSFEKMPLAATEIPSNVFCTSFDSLRPLHSPALSSWEEHPLCALPLPLEHTLTSVPHTCMLDTQGFPLFSSSLSHEK